MERKEKGGTGQVQIESGHLSIALHPYVTDDSGQPLGLSTNHSGFSCRDDFGGVESQNPFPQVSEAARNSKPGYSWPPHLYQESKKLVHFTLPEIAILQINAA